jgi:hypothetical protein
MSAEYQKIENHQEQTHPAEIDLSKWAVILNEAINTPGMLLEAYRAFHSYSIGNQILAIIQCNQRGISPGPIKTFPGWQSMGRNVKKGEKALVLCMPVTVKRKGEESETGEPKTFTLFTYKPRWFVLSQTDGEEMPAPEIPAYDTDRALSSLGIERIPFSMIDGNCQGFAQKRQIAINPVAQLPHKTFFHEVAHVMLGHTEESDFADNEQTPRNLREVEAESVALLCCESLQLEGAVYCRGYIQGWLRGDVIPEKSAQKILRTADQILRAGQTAE